jgi:ABC-2 type transport system ATP-binding protein
MSDLAIELAGVTRTFGSGARRRLALDRLSLEVAPGSVLGLVGRNGAGKTTTLRLALGLLHPDAGRIRTLGLDPVAQGLQVRTRVSLLSEESSLYPWMSVGEIVDYAGALHPRWDGERARRLLGRLGLSRRARIRELSRGTRAKVAFLIAAACRPEVLLLDDPTAGLDPLVRREVLEGIVETIPEEGGAVVYASHMIQDVERVADHVAVLDGGRLVLSGSVEELRERVRRVTAVFEGDAPVEVDLPGQLDCRAEGRTLRVVCERRNGGADAELRSMGARAIESESLDLEDILVACLHGRAEREVHHVEQ